jgi:hypothetical protein
MKTLIFGPSVIGVIYGGDVIHTAPADNQRRNLMPTQETTSTDNLQVYSTNSVQDQYTLWQILGI